MAKIIEFKPRPKKAPEPSKSVNGNDDEMKAAFEGLIAQVLNDDTVEMIRQGRVQVRSAIEILESSETLRVRMALPGFDRSQIKARIRKNILKVLITGKAAEKDKILFSQALPIPSAVDAEFATAIFENEMLIVDFPKITDEDGENGIEIPIT